MSTKIAENVKRLSPELRALDTFISGVKTLRAQVFDGALTTPIDRAVELIAFSKGRLIVAGVGKSGHIARKLAATFSSTGTPAYFLHPTEASHGDLGMIDEGDVVLALSWSGETSELAALISHTKRFSVDLIAMTAGETSTLASAADIALILPRVREACPHNLAPTTSTLLQLALGDAVAVAVMTRKGFTARDFSVFHPGGKLGTQLRRVGDMMHTDNLPLLPLSSRMREAILAMTSGGFGAAGIVGEAGELIGVVTDGDLRRLMRNDNEQGVLDTPVDRVMTHAPLSSGPQMLAGEALDLLQSRKVSVLFVVEEGRPIGIVHLHDLLRAGVA